MRELYGIVNGVMTVLLIVIFIGLVAWAWSKRRHEDFERAARLPLEEDAGSTGERRP